VVPQTLPKGTKLKPIYYNNLHNSKRFGNTSCRSSGTHPAQPFAPSLLANAQRSGRNVPRIAEKQGPIPHALEINIPKNAPHLI
jgi:hypothetical protein